MNVIKIPAKPQKGNNAAKQEVKKLRVAAYCRVSTDNEEQATSYETQIEHYTEFINKNPEWELVKVYADDGISATSTKGREQFNAMIEDCKKGLIDMIFTKSISRFARNTVDCLNYIRMLKEMNIPVFFENGGWMHSKKAKTFTVPLLLRCSMYRSKNTVRTLI